MLHAILLAAALNSPLENQIYRLCKHEFPKNTAVQKAKYYAPLIQKVAKKHKVPAPVLASLIWHESNYKPGLVSHAGARGLMQVMPFWFKRGQNWRDPKTNLEVGTSLLVQYRNRYHGDWHRALTAYCMGPVSVSRGRYRSRYSNQVLKKAW